ncbi:MAG: hypothetical protein AAF962_16840 [Actinomycetota bacterium]
MIADLLIIAGLTSLAFSIVVVTSWRVRPTSWAQDLGVDTDDQVGPLVTGSLITLILFGGALGGAAVGESLFTSFVGAWAVVAFVGLVDLLVVDSLIHLVLRPSWMWIGGVDDVDFQFHLQSFWVSLVVALPVAGLAVAMVTAVR